MKIYFFKVTVEDKYTWKYRELWKAGYDADIFF